MLTHEDLFRLMMEKRVLEAHLVPGSPIMLRDKTGDLSPTDANILSPGDTKKFVSDMMNDNQKNEFIQKNEIDFAISVPGLSRYSISIFMQRNSISAIIKTVPPAPPTFEELGLPDVFKSISTRVQRGLVVICGPKGSGKSHTLAAMINYIIENRSCKIVTLENPIKFLFKNKKGIICQREVGIDVKNPLDALDSIQHLGADIIIVNEISSYETASRILTLAAGGYLVFVTAIAPSVQVILETIIDLYPANLHDQCKTYLAVGFEAGVSQVLCKKVSGDGVIPAFEICIATPPVKVFLKEGKIPNIYQIMASSGREAGMTTQEHTLRSMIKKNIITQEEAFSRAVRPEELRKILALPF
ncbi:MAG: ATPase, T2SS/T4P/T4SS family [Candidatus Eremiobacteraeota bacterium]|nr:ATPase, T2SS/T4P/T4SS family [Candidatus Eremiobacteraeota bacterium]